MKIRPLPEIDLARVSTMRFEQQRKALQQIRYGRPPFSYAPFRSGYNDIFNVQLALFGHVRPTEWPVIQAMLQRRCRNDEELAANIGVAKGLHDFATAAGLVGRAQEFFPLAMSAGRKVSYWLPMVLGIGGRVLVPFIDPRRSRGLTSEARRFVFSMMHERIRVADPDYADVSLGIFQFGDGEDAARVPVLHLDDSIDLFPVSELERMVAATYELWREVCEEREVEGRRKATGTTGPLI